MLSTFPSALRWIGRPVASAVGENAVEITAGPRSDWFVDPRTGVATLSAPALVGEADGDFLLGARVEVAFGETFDAGPRSGE